MSSDIIKQFQTDKEGLLKHFGGDWAKVVEAIAAASAPETKTEAVTEGADAIQQALADADIDSKVVGKNIQVPNESLSKAKAIVKKIDPDQTVVGGLHEGVKLTGLQSFKDFFQESTGIKLEDKKDPEDDKKDDGCCDDKDGKKKDPDDKEDDLDEKKAK